ncbi:carboxylesterase [Seiridium cupressi]
MLHHVFIWAHLSILIASLIAGARATDHGDCIANTPHSRIIGHRSGIQSEVCEFLGIPYAAAPVQDLRFAPPEARNLTADFVANTWVSDHHNSRACLRASKLIISRSLVTQGADCPQNPASLFAYPNATSQYSQLFTRFVSTTATNHTQSEDCLKLNIWIKADALKLNASHPVLMWIHGGRHSSGTSNTPFYNGANFAASKNAAFVTFNFRMNIFGFPGAPEATQNVGLLDHYAAVQWVHDNIKYFGASPARMALFGQSSGAAAVGNWAYAFKEKPLVAGIASHSGNQFAFPTNSLELAASNWYNVSGTLGCGTSGTTLECMRSSNITFQQILNAVKKVPTVPTNSPARSQPQFQVTQDNKTWFSTEEYISRVKSGNLADIPYLQIHGNHESGFYRISALAQGNTLTEEAWEEFERETFTCAAAAEAYYRTELGIPSYRSRYMADWENTRLYDPPSSGAYHGVEIYMVTGNSDLVSGITPVEAQTDLTTSVSDRWWWFANDAANGLADAFGWPRYNASAETLGLIGTGNTSRIEFVDPSLYDSQCPEIDLDYWDSAIPA